MPPSWTTTRWCIAAAATMAPITPYCANWLIATALQLICIPDCTTTRWYRPLLLPITPYYYRVLIGSLTALKLICIDCTWTPYLSRFVIISNNWSVLLVATKRTFWKWMSTRPSGSNRQRNKQTSWGWLFMFFCALLAFRMSSWWSSSNKNWKLPSPTWLKTDTATKKKKKPNKQTK